MPECGSCGENRDELELSECGTCGIKMCGMGKCPGLCACDMAASVNSAEELMRVAAPLRPHVFDFVEVEGQEFTLEELAQFACLLAKRAAHRADPVKRDKDLHDSGNYILLMQERIEAMKEQVQ